MLCRRKPLLLSTNRVFYFQFFYNFDRATNFYWSSTLVHSCALLKWLYSCIWHALVHFAKLKNLQPHITVWVRWPGPPRGGNRGHFPRAHLLSQRPWWCCGKWPQSGHRTSLRGSWVACPQNIQHTSVLCAEILVGRIMTTILVFSPLQWLMWLFFNCRCSLPFSLEPSP